MNAPALDEASVPEASIPSVTARPTRRRSSASMFDPALLKLLRNDLPDA